MNHSFNRHTTIFDAILNAASVYGNNKFIIEDINRQPISYKQLILRAIVLGNVIRRDTQCNKHIGIMMPNVIGTAITFLAVQYATRIPAMINFTAGAQTMMNICRTASIQTIYTSRKFIHNADLHDATELLAKKVHLIYMEDVLGSISIWDKLTGLFRSSFIKIHYRSLSKNISTDSPGCILFTSGSDGCPKGVVLSHHNILSNYAQIISRFDFRPNDLFFSCLPLFHTFGLSGGFLFPLLSGSKIFLYSTPLHYKNIPKLIAEIKATVLFGSNTFLKKYASYAQLTQFQTLRYVVAGAEKLHYETWETWLEKFNIKICQGYGVTETSPVISANTPLQNKPNSVGHFMPEMEYYLKPVEGVDNGGQLFVKGPNVMSGYLLPGEEGQIKPPVSERGLGWHNTGDIAEVDEDGYLYIVGRTKHFAKIAGEMISLATVEELAANLWGGHHHAAVSLPDDKKGEKIILVTNNQHAIKNDLQEHIRKNNYSELYMPKEIFSTDALPILGSWKTDYTALRKMLEEGEIK